jgi:TM2 domain-containing membrane protein YozV
MNKKDKTVAILLAFFLGAFGGHKFYLGQITMGIVYLIFCWTLIPSIVSFVEFILLIIMKPEEFDAKYNSGGQPVA